MTYEVVVVEQGDADGCRHGAALPARPAEEEAPSGEPWPQMATCARRDPLALQSLGTHGASVQ